jgi:hypothetical protein
MSLNLDTRGDVGGTRWKDLTPFAAGYVEAALREAHTKGLQNFFTGEPPPFRSLAPATLAAMLKDCEAWHPNALDNMSAAMGAELWRHSKRTLYLGDDAKVYQREAA